MDRADLDKLWSETTKKIRTDKTFIPFNSKFDNSNFIDIADRVLCAISNGETPYKGVGRQLLDLCYCAPAINTLFKKINDDFKMMIFESGLSVAELELLLFATVNRDYFILKEETEIFSSKYAANKNVTIDLTTMPSPTIKSPMKSIGEVNTSSMAEGSVDSIILLLNYLKQFEEDGSTVQPLCDLDAVRSVYELYVRSNFAYVLKYDFEDIIWNDGYVLCNTKNKAISYDYFSHNDLKLRCAGHRILLSRVYDKRLHSNCNNKHTFNKYLKHKRIKNTYIHDGYVKFKLSSGRDNDIASIMTDFHASLNAYYAYLVDVPFMTTPSLNIEKSLVIFGSISRLLLHIQIKVDDTEVTTKREFYNYPFRIAKADLKQYIQNTTNFNSKEINGFLELLEANSKYINLWNDPFIKRGGDYYFALLPITMPVIYNIVDNWLRKGGLSLDDRGVYFEDYIRRELKASDPICKFECTQIEQKTFVGCNSKEEEIDLLLVLRDVIILGEIKCITYPTEVRDYHNANKRLREGCKQAVRKSEFLRCNHKTLLHDIGDYKHKRIIKVVITNYPLFTGMTHNKVPIIDADTFICYFKSGTILQKVSGMESSRVQDEIEGCRLLYTCEKEFNGNIESYLSCPPIVDQVVDHVKIKRMKRSPDTFIPSIFSTHADL